MSDCKGGILAAGIDLGVISVSALADQALFEQLQAAALRGGAQLHVLAGRGSWHRCTLAAARAGSLDEVHYSSRKPPASWKNTPAEQMLDLARLNTATVFCRHGREAAPVPGQCQCRGNHRTGRRGFENTRVQLIADPATSGNIHHIRARGRFRHTQH
ncbi:MAG: hypothetical protein R3F53_22805 [Gammaproteobacteria bacterium]